MIHCNDVIKIYTDEETKTRIAALRGIDLRVKKGEVISIIGPSGSGKSTLIQIFAGMLTISSGEVRVGSYEIGKLELDELLEYRLNMVGLVHQFPERTLFLSGTVIDNLNFASSLYSDNRSENRRRNMEILETLGIAHLENRRVSYLSGGEMIRTAIASALAKNAPLLLCDEPTGQLDTENTEIVKKMLRQIAREYGTTVLVVTHDMRFLKGVDKTCEIHSGRVSSLFNVEESGILNQREFPIFFKGQIDSSQNIRIPNEVYDLLHLKDKVDFVVTEDSKVEILHPDGIPPKKIDVKEMKKQKKLSITPLKANYFDKKEIEISLKGVDKIYRSKNLEVPALTDIDLEIIKGELAFIIGPSGSGKTTIIKLVTGMEPCSAGNISVLNEELHNLNDAERAKFRRNNIGIVSQQGDLHPFITVTENLFIRDMLSGNNIILKKYPQDKIEETFTKFQIDHRKNSYPLEVSGGELQRASLAIANFGTPGFLILDEPTANMDAELADNVMDQLYKIHEELKITLLITTHDINLVRDGTRVIELKDGKIFNDGKAITVEEEI